MRKRRFGALAFLVSLLCLQSAWAHAEPLALEGGANGSAGSVDLPVGWSMEASGNAFKSATGEARLRVLTYSVREFGDARSMSDALQSRLGAQGEGTTFVYAGMPAYIADLRFEAAGTSFRGYLITLIGKQKAVALLGFATNGSYERLRDELLSSLDSYSYDPHFAEYPGPVSQFLYPFPAPHRVPMKVYVGGQERQLGVDVREIDVSQSIIDRETRVLAENKKVNVAAWRRYYRMIYRDNYHRFDDYLPAVKETFSRSAQSPSAEAQSVLSWMQGFLYARTGTLADISNPLLTFVTQTGDCDSRTLLYSIILHHLGIESILMVSSVYSHSMVGVLVDGSGARIRRGGKAYLVAELTAPVSLGMIDRQMSDPKGWVTIELDPRQAPTSVSSPP